MSFRYVKVGDTIRRRMGRAGPIMELKVTEVTEHCILVGPDGVGWKFDRDHGYEIDEELGLGCGERGCDVYRELSRTLMCDQYPVHTALIHEPESVHRLTEGACPRCALPLQQHEHPFMKRFTDWTPNEWRFGLCPKCLKCWRVELQGENPPSGMVYEVTPKCHEDQVKTEQRGGVYA